MSKRSRDDNEEPISLELFIKCQLPPCWKDPPIFKSYDEYESHIQTYHTHICNQCHKKFPSDRYLLIHIEENHDPFFQINKERGVKVYRCLNAQCTKMCSSRGKRKLHMIDKHGYPKDFNFRVLDLGIL